MEINYEAPADFCPVCHVDGMSPCVDADGNDTDDHPGQPVDLAAATDGELDADCP